MLIAFEGLPGTGKTTQARLLAEHLRATGGTVTYLPDLATLVSDGLADRLFDLFSASGDPFKRSGDVTVDTLLAAAIRANIVAVAITPQLATGHTVIEDRGAHTMYSYSLATIMQRHRGTDPAAAIGWLKACGSLAGGEADLAIRLRVPVDVAATRAAARPGATAFTGEQQTYLQHVHTAYDRLEEHDRHLVGIDAASLDPGDVHAAVLETLERHGR